MGDEEAKHAAMVEFVGTFPTLSGARPKALSDLSDGVVLFEVLSEIAPDHFDPTTIARHLGDNWALKSSNLRKLVRNLEWYYHEDLKKDADFDQITSNLGNIARTGDPAAIAALVELVAAAAVTCELKGEFVGRIMGMSQDSQIQMKGIIESSLQRLQEYDGNDDGADDNEMIFDEATAEDKGEDQEEAVENLFDANHLKQSDADREQLEQALLHARREMAQQKSQLGEFKEDADKAQSKLRALVEDLQDRLARRQDELIVAEEELRTATNDLDDTKSNVSELEEAKAQLEDELDVANAKTTQLHKAEATVLAYRRKLEGVGVMNQQMTDLEDQSAGYLRQIMDLESEVKKTASLQKQLDILQVQLGSLKKEKLEKTDALKNTSAEIAELKSLLSSAEKAKKMFQEELKELRARQAVDHEEVSAVEGFDSQAHDMSAKAREKTMRLEIENKKLKELVEGFKTSAASVAPVAADSSSAPVSGDAASLQAELNRLKEVLAKKDSRQVRLRWLRLQLIPRLHPCQGTLPPCRRSSIGSRKCWPRRKPKTRRLEATRTSSRRIPRGRLPNSKTSIWLLFKSARRN
jgi:protein HOOK3